MQGQPRDVVNIGHVNVYEGIININLDKYQDLMVAFRVNNPKTTFFQVGESIAFYPDTISMGV